MKKLSDKEARLCLAKYEPLVQMQARRFIAVSRKATLHGHDVDDLAQIGRMAVIEAISSYQDQSPIAERVFVRVRVFQRIIDAIRSDTFMSRDDLTMLTKHNGGGELSEKQAKRLERIKSWQHASYGDALFERPETVRPIVEMLGDRDAILPDEALDIKREVERFASALTTLTPRQSEAFREIIFGKLQLKQVGDQMGISESRVCQLRKHAAKKIASSMRRRRAAVEISCSRPTA